MDGLNRSLRTPCQTLFKYPFNYSFAVTYIIFDSKGKSSSTGVTGVNIQKYTINQVTSLPKKGFKHNLCDYIYSRFVHDLVTQTIFPGDGLNINSTSCGQIKYTYIFTPKKTNKKKTSKARCYLLFFSSKHLW